MDTKKLALLTTLVALLANAILAFAGIPNTISCTLAYAAAHAQELIASPSLQ